MKSKDFSSLLLVVVAIFAGSGKSKLGKRGAVGVVADVRCVIRVESTQTQVDFEKKEKEMVEVLMIWVRCCFLLCRNASESFLYFVLRLSYLLSKNKNIPPPDIVKSQIEIEEGTSLLLLLFSPKNPFATSESTLFYSEKASRRNEAARNGVRIATNLDRLQPSGRHRRGSHQSLRKQLQSTLSFLPFQIIQPTNQLTKLFL